MSCLGLLDKYYAADQDIAQSQGLIDSYLASIMAE